MRAAAMQRLAEMIDQEARRAVCMGYVAALLSIMGPPQPDISRILVLIEPDEEEHIQVQKRDKFITDMYTARALNDTPCRRIAIDELVALADPPDAPPDALRFLLNLGGGRHASVVATWRGSSWAVT